MEIFAREIKKGDKINMFLDGWKTVVKIEKRSYFICVTFEDGHKHDFFNDEIIWRT